MCFPLRDYKRGNPAHLLGYMREVNKDFLNNANKTNKALYKSGDLIGKNGVERKFEEYLRGKEGTENLQVDALGRLRFLSGGKQNREEPIPGHNVELTIDSDIQEAASLAFRNKHGAVIALNAQTGEVLAYVSNPNYDLAIFQDKLSSKDWVPLSTNRFRPLLDRVTGGQYPPGSTFKIITALAALEENLVTPSKTFFCNGVFRLGNRPFQCWKKVGHGHVNLRKSLEQSCDVYYYQIANMLGVEKIAHWARLYGLGSKSELNLNTEATGLVPTSDWKLKNKGVKWQKGDTINLSIGQGFMLTTPIQVANMFAAIGNGGKLFKPYILKRVVSSTGKVLVEEKPTLRWTIPAKKRNVELIKKGLWDVVNAPSGTGKRSRVKGFTIAGKNRNSPNS